MLSATTFRQYFADKFSEPDSHSPLCNEMVNIKLVHCSAGHLMDRLLDSVTAMRVWPGGHAQNVTAHQSTAIEPESMNEEHLYYNNLRQ